MGRFASEQDSSLATNQDCDAFWFSNRPYFGRDNVAQRNMRTVGNARLDRMH